MIENASTVILLDTRAWSIRRFVLKALETAQNGVRLSMSIDISLVSLIAPSIIAVAFFSLVSCTTISEDKQYEREDARIRTAERYWTRLQGCRKAGGVMMTHRKATRLNKPYTRREMNHALCVRW